MMFILQENNSEYITEVCNNTPELSELSISNIKTYSDEASIIQVKPFVEVIDSVIVENIDKYMCSEQCPCDP